MNLIRIWTPITLASHQYEMYLNEMGKADKSMMELTPQGTVPRGGIASVIVPPGNARSDWAAAIDAGLGLGSDGGNAHAGI